MPSSSPQSLVHLYGRIGGLRTRSRHDPAQYTSAARQAFLKSFELEVDPQGILPLDERRARANAARRAHMARIAYLSAVARAKKRQSGGSHADGEVSL